MPRDANDVTHIEQLKQLKCRGTHDVELHVDLQLLPLALDMCETGLAVQSNGENAASNRNVHVRFLEFGRAFLIVSADDLLRRLLPSELMRIGIKAQANYLFQFFLALQKLIARFEFQAALRFSLSRAQYSERVCKASRKRRVCVYGREKGTTPEPLGRQFTEADIGDTIPPCAPVSGPSFI
jgi:hypothetical protein